MIKIYQKYIIFCMCLHFRVRRSQVMARYASYFNQFQNSDTIFTSIPILMFHFERLQSLCILKSILGYILFDMQNNNRGLICRERKLVKDIGSSLLSHGKNEKERYQACQMIDIFTDTCGHFSIKQEALFPCKSFSSQNVNLQS